VRKTLIGINNKDKTASSSLLQNKTVSAIPIQKKTSIFTFFLLLKPVEYIMPRKLTNAISKNAAVRIRFTALSISLLNLKN
jgi:hypothetical protein